ncbi:hypothetical protein XELAEV_18033505mg [Xenopus laevis]|uniref:Uncharacterized protein n=1 Tax=Xenopus laevis TaxID=8355 RepID=A0A974HE32_XENLA|nr:hypothetical protein XELAEV_18033505mg [Xenopus laevis]
MTVAKDTNAIPSTSSAANTSVVTSQTSAPPTIIVAKETNAIPSTSSLWNLQNNVMFPQNPSTTTRGIYEYITLSDMECATRAHQQQVALQKQMKYLRESPFSVQENSPLFRNPIPETRKRKLDTNSEDAAFCNPKLFKLRLGKGPKPLITTMAELFKYPGKVHFGDEDDIRNHFRNLQNYREKEIKAWCQKETLLQYAAEGIEPRGLRITKKWPTFSRDDANFMLE